eukprot:1145149-Pelagomonas_calceolata.AAC.6
METWVHEAKQEEMFKMLRSGQVPLRDKVQEVGNFDGRNNWLPFQLVAALRKLMFSLVADNAQGHVDFQLCFRAPLFQSLKACVHES